MKEERVTGSLKTAFINIVFIMYLFIYLFNFFTQGMPKQLETGFHWGPAYIASY